MKKFIAVILAASASIVLSAETPGLSFGKNGAFRILQITDSHLKLEMPQEHEKTFARIDHVVKAEKPDCILVTGDVVTGIRGNRDGMWKLFIQKMDGYGIPYAIVFGNHDAEGMDELPRPEMSRLVVSGRYCLNSLNEAGELADIRIPVFSSDGKKNALDLYMLDSHDYPENQGFDNKYGKYAWFSHAQVEWLRKECMASTAANGGRHVPSLAFFHIALCEYDKASGENKVIGMKGEPVCCAPVNSGMFCSMYETGNVMGVFVGHDHDNNFITTECGIALGYGGYSGDDTTYNHLAHGLRLIDVKEGGRSFTTWIHEEDDRIQFRAEFKDGTLTKLK